MADNFAKLNLGKRTVDDAPPGAREVLQQAQQKIGMVPNMYAYMANAPGLLQTYMHGYELFRKNSGFTLAEQEVIFLSISFENGCEYCMAAPSMLADTQSKVPPAVTEALRTGDHVPDERLRSLSEFTRTMVTGRGRPSEEDLQKFLNDGFTSEQVLQIVLAVGVKTFSNYANHMCHTPVDAAFEHRKWTKPRSASHVAA